MTESIVKVTIPKGQTLSQAIDTRSGQLVRIMLPGDWTAAPLCIQTSPDNNLWNTLIDRAGNDFSINFQPASVYLTSSAYTRSLGWVRLQSGSRQSGLIKQAADREFTLILYTP